MFVRVLRPYRGIPGVFVIGKYTTEVFGKVRYGPRYSAEHSGMVEFGTNSIPVPVPDSSVTSVLPPKIPWVPVPVYPIFLTRLCRIGRGSV